MVNSTTTFTATVDDGTGGGGYDATVVTALDVDGCVTVAIGYGWVVSVTVCDVSKFCYCLSF